MAIFSGSIGEAGLFHPIFKPMKLGIGGAGGGSVGLIKSNYLQGVPLLGDQNHPLSALKGKRILLITDYNLPIDKKTGKVNIFRIEKSAPTVKAILENAGRLIIASHFGRPEGKVSSKYSLDPVLQAFEEYFKIKVVPHRIELKEGESLSPAVLENVIRITKSMANGQVMFLPNIRFWPQEESKSANERKALGEALAKLADIYINDAFGAAHRAHASKDSVHLFLPTTNFALGFLIQEEINNLEKVRDIPQQPLVTFLGGAKVVDKFKKIDEKNYEIKEGKIKAVLKLMEKGKVMVGGKIIYAFLAVMGISFGDGYKGTNPDEINAEIFAANEALKSSQFPIGRLILPPDLVIVPSDNPEAERSVVSFENGIPDGYIQGDVGPKSCELIDQLINEAKTVIGNIAFGWFEKGFDQGTKTIAQGLQKPGLIVAAGGGETEKALTQYGIILSGEKFLSTGGGVMINFLASEKLPAIEALRRK